MNQRFDVEDDYEDAMLAGNSAPEMNMDDQLELQQALLKSLETHQQDRAKQRESEDLHLLIALQESTELASEQWKRDEEERMLAMQLEDSYRTSLQHQRQQNDALIATALTMEDVFNESTAQENLRQCLTNESSLTTTITRLNQEYERWSGSWDCPDCTYRNDPYRTPCSACGRAAPPHVLTFASFPDHLRFGVEIEIIIPDGKKDGYKYQWVAQELSKLGADVEYAGYTHNVSQEWKIVTDSSLSASRDDLCFELVSPILMGEGENGLAKLRFLLECIRKLGIATNSTCGFHVHVDAESGPMATLSGLQRLVQCFVALESAFDCLVARDSRDHARQRRTNRNKYCQSNRLAFGTMSNRQRWDRIAATQSINELVGLVNPNQDRYRKLNMTSLARSSNRPAKTCEFRQHGGVNELLAAEAWVRLIVRFCHITSSCGTASLSCLLPQQATELDELKSLFELVDCAGLHEYYTVDRRLFSLQTPTAHNSKQKDWKCKHCKRRFASSQSLSQHGIASGHSIS